MLLVHIMFTFDFSDRQASVPDCKEQVARRCQIPHFFYRLIPVLGRQSLQIEHNHLKQICPWTAMHSICFSDANLPMNCYAFHLLFWNKSAHELLCIPFAFLKQICPWTAMHSICFSETNLPMNCYAITFAFPDIEY